MVIAGETLKEAPDPIDVPPQLPLYQVHELALFSVPDTMLSVVTPFAQVGFTVAVTVGVVGLIQTGATTKFTVELLKPSPFEDRTLNVYVPAGVAAVVVIVSVPALYDIFTPNTVDHETGLVENELITPAGGDQLTSDKVVEIDPLPDAE